MIKYWLLVIGMCCTVTARQPNVVIIYADDLNPSGIGCYGGKALTPNIDKLAKEGIRFTRYYATSAVCSPSRYSLLTGRYAARCKALQDDFPSGDVALIRWNCRLEGGEKTIAHLLGRAGYTSALVGKHHNIENMAYQTRVPLDADPRDPAVKKTIQKNYDTLVEQVRETTGFTEVINLYANNFHTLDMPQPLHHHNQDWVTDGAVKFIEASKDGPFFMHMALTIPHGPDPLLSMEADPRITPHGYLDKAPRVQPSRKDVFERVEKAGLPREAAPYTWLDDAVGAVFQALEKAGIADNTIIFFASDHNELGKMTCYDLGCKTPAILWWPGHLPAGVVNDELVANIDIAPTLLAACGVTSPADNAMDGIDLIPMLGKGGSVRDQLLLEITYTKGIVSKDWKYIATRFPKKVKAMITHENRKTINQEGVAVTYDPIAGAVAARYGVSERFPGYYDDDQLYNLNSDADEVDNLATNPEYTKQMKEMRSTLKTMSRDFPHVFGEFGRSKGQ
ncbi:MAG: sulfatase-like hydrolase/transferase [Kiritimatiellales bacterium]|nr:sulfatase-like hydrolase/transferase [Kiritimatiellales bacterium]